MAYHVEAKGRMHLVVNTATGTTHGAYKEKSEADDKARAMFQRDKQYIKGENPK